MDTTKEYIEMCREAKEIQKQWCPFPSHAVVGDIYAELRPNIIEWKVQTYTRATSGLCAWLPRQDQLQDMLEDVFSNREIVPFTAKLHDVCIHLIQKHNFNGRTMEQLWLAFVMHEKCGKTWNSNKKEWI